jgi:starvation-inducible outer membrane lipoprotein
MKLLLTLVLVLSACQTAPRRADLDSDLARINSLVQAAYEVGATAGLGVGIVVDGRLEYSAHLGVADAA